jgi:hypothetical protein
MEMRHFLFLYSFRGTYKVWNSHRIGRGSDAGQTERRDLCPIKYCLVMNIKGRIMFYYINAITKKYFSIFKFLLH